VIDEKSDLNDFILSSAFHFLPSTFFLSSGRGCPVGDGYSVLSSCKENDSGSQAFDSGDDV
jgi:hypothetical protein